MDLFEEIRHGISDVITSFRKSAVSTCVVMLADVKDQGAGCKRETHEVVSRMGDDQDSLERAFSAHLHESLD